MGDELLGRYGLSSRQFGPETVDDQLREPRIPVFLRQLLFGQEGPQLRSHLELGDEKADHVVRPKPLDERMGCVIRVLGLCSPQRVVVLEKADETGIGKVLQLLLRERHGYGQRTIRVVQPAATKAATSCKTKNPTVHPYSQSGPPSASHAMHRATVTRLRPNVPNNAMPAIRYGRTTAAGALPAYD